MPTSSELIAHGRSVEEISAALGADWLIYQDLEDLVAAVQKGNRDITSFDCSVFTGEYVTGGVSDTYFAGLAQQRSDVVKSRRRSTDQHISDL